MKKVYLNSLTVYDFLYDKIYNCSDLELIGSDKKAYDIINKLIKVKEIRVDKNLYDSNNIVVHKADICVNNVNAFLGIYFVSGTGFDISKEIQITKDQLKIQPSGIDLASICLFKPDEWFLVIPSIEPDHQYDIIVFMDILVHVLNNYNPIHLDNGKLIINSPKDFDVVNFTIGNLGLEIPYFIVERIFHLLNITDYYKSILSMSFDQDFYILQLVGIYNYLQKANRWTTLEINKYMLQLMIDINYSSIIFDIDYVLINRHKKLVKVIEEIANIDDEIKKSFIDFSILLYDIHKINVKKNNIKLKLLKK